MGKGRIIELGPDKYPFDIEQWFPADLNTVGISFTGGIESTALLCACMTQYTKQQINLFHIQHNQTPHMHRVADWFGVSNIQKIRMIDLIDEREFLMQVWLRANEHSHIDMLYVGANANQSAMGYGYDIEKTWKLGFAAPFHNLRKYHAIDLIRQLGFEDVLKHTFSCCHVTDTHCGECENCIERREQGFNVLGMEDPYIRDGGTNNDR
jgi:Queuosine biosynthesis protein QueC